MKKLLEIGDLYVSNFVKETPEELKKYSLDLVLDEELGCPRLKEVAPMSDMYGQYWYRSGINDSMVKQLKEIAEEISDRVKYKKGDVWLDIACNDGTMFKFIPDEFIKVGIDPADDTFLEPAKELADSMVQDFFSEEAYRKAFIGKESEYKKAHIKKANVITTIAMFYDLDDPRSFLDDINAVLDDDGVWVLQLSYTPLMILQLAFDNICHEHVYYYSLNSLKKLFAEKDLKIVDCSVNETNGGSFRVYVQKNNAKPIGSVPFRDVCTFRIASVLAKEESMFRYGIEPVWEDFERRLEKLKNQTLDFIREEKAKGKKIFGYGASTKGNTLLQLFGLDSSLITAIAERSPAKFGLKTVGTDIPIISEEEMRAEKPDYLLVLPWHFIEFFVEREQDFLNAGGKFIVPCPNFEIIGKE